MTKNINGYCPHCNSDMDGDLVINHPLSLGKSMEEALRYASFYEGWGEHKELNRWSRKIAFYDCNKDRTTAYSCPDCNKEWKRDW